MNNNLTELVFILDRSGSMGGLESDTIGGFNSMLEEQKEGCGDVLLSTILFDDKIEFLHDRVDIKTVEKLTRNDYRVGGCTALLDALGNAINHIDKVQKNSPESIRPGKTMFIITTDGLENSSHEYTYASIKKLVEQKKEGSHWEFIFLGANMDAISAAADIGISADRASNYHSDSKGTEVNYRALSRAVSCMRACKEASACGAALESWDEEIVKDYSRRKK